MTFLKIVLFIAFTAVNLKAQSQSRPQLETEDSLIHLLEKTNVDSTKLNLLTKLAALNSPTDKEKSINYYQQALTLDIDNKSKAPILNKIGFYYWSLGNFDTALTHYHQSLLMYNQLNDSSRIGMVLNNIAAASWSLGKWNDALENYQTGIKYRRATKDIKGVSNLLNNIGLVYQDFGAYNEALNYHNEALEVALEINNSAGISYSYSNIGLCYMRMTELKLALKYHKLGFKIYSKNENNGRNNSYFLANIGMIFSKSGQLDSALYYFNRSLEQAILINNQHRIAIAESNLGKNYLRLGEIKIAAKHLNNSNRSALVNNYKDLLRDNQFALAEIEEQRGNDKMALNYYKNAVAIRDSLFNKEEVLKFTQITIRKIQEKEQNEKSLLRENIEIQKSEIRKERIIRWVITSGGLLILVALIYITRSRRSIKKLNSQLLKSEKELKQANADKIKFFSIISHDLRSPFNSIIGLSNLLTLEIKAKNIENIGMYASTIHSASQKAMNLLSNLTEWALSQTGRMKFTVEKYDINGIINENTLFFSDIAKQKSISVITKLDNTLYVDADKSMINTILRNLISNAIKFTASGGSIQVSSELKKNKVEIAVSDNGVGLSETSIEKLFRIDTQFSTSGTQDEEGTGLGLMLCKEFIEKHNEKIWVVSELGKGSTFYFTLPYSQSSI